MLEDWSDSEDRLLAHDVFGTDSPKAVQEMILDWVAKHGFGRACVSAVGFSVGAAVTLMLPDRSNIFVKVWPQIADARALAAQSKVQAAMAARGFPAPSVLTGLSALGPGWAGPWRWSTTGLALQRM